MPSLLPSICVHIKYKERFRFVFPKGTQSNSWTPPHQLSDSYTHTLISYPYIIPVSHKNYSQGYILHFLKKKLNKKLPYYIGENNFFDTLLELSYVIICLIQFQLASWPNCIFFWWNGNYVYWRCSCMYESDKTVSDSCKIHSVYQ